MRVISSTKVRAIENYESKKENWLLQVAADPEVSGGALRVAIAIGLHMNRKQQLLAWPGFGRLQKMLGIDRSTVIRGVKALERRGHMRVVRSRNGTKNHPNHYHPNIWRTGVVAAVPLGSGEAATRVVAGLPPEPMNEPIREPTIRKDITPAREASLGFASPAQSKRLGEVERVKPSFIGQHSKPLQRRHRCSAFLAVSDYLARLAPELTIGVCSAPGVIRSDWVTAP